MESMTVEQVKNRLDYTDKGIREIITNYVTALRYDENLQGVFRQNIFTDRIDVIKTKFVNWNRQSTSIEDIDLVKTLLYLAGNYGLKNKQTLTDAIRIVANDFSYHPVRDYLNGLEWDHTERIRYALHRFLGAEQNEYSYEVMKLLMMGAIERVFNPGSKFDYIVCLVGGQGIGKSSFVQFLAINPEWFADDLSNLADENIVRKLQGHLFVEFGEMIPTGNAKNVEIVKAFISRQKDNYKVPYDRFSKDIPRQCVFVGTTNNLEFLPFDRTGNRRFLPVLCYAAGAECTLFDDVNATRDYIDQMWAEAMELKKTGCYELKPSRVMLDYLDEHQCMFMPEDTMAGEIQGWLDEYLGDEVCTKQVAVECLGIPNPTKFQYKDIADAMRNVVSGWTLTREQKRFPQYGTQKIWRRNKPKADENGFVEMPDDMELPFK